MATRARILADYVSGGATAAEFDYLDGVTSNIQTQMDLKAPLASPTLVTPALGTPASGVLTNATFPDGHVIQTVVGTADSNAQTKTVSGSAGATWELKTAPTVEITPSSDDNLILLLGTMFTDNQSDMIFVDLYRSGSGVTDSTLATDGGISGETAGFGYTYNAGARGISMHPFAWVDNPSWSSGAITYQYMFRASSTSVAVVIGQPATATRLIAMEIKG